MYTGFIQFLDSLLGTYTPQTVTIDGVVHTLSGMAGVDFAYIARACVFCITIWAIFRILGGLLCRK